MARKTDEPKRKSVGPAAGDGAAGRIEKARPEGKTPKKQLQQQKQQEAAVSSAVKAAKATPAKKQQTFVKAKHNGKGKEKTKKVAKDEDDDDEEEEDEDSGSDFGDHEAARLRDEEGEDDDEDDDEDNDEEDSSKHNDTAKNTAGKVGKGAIKTSGKKAAANDEANSKGKKNSVLARKDNSNSNSNSNSNGNDDGDDHQSSGNEDGAAHGGENGQKEGSSLPAELAAMDRDATAAFEALSEEEKKLLKEQEGETTTLLRELQAKISDATDHCNGMAKQIAAGAFPTDQGVSFLEMKLHCLLQYNMNLSLVVMLKAEGRSLVNHPAIERLVYYRTVLERIKPIDSKLKSQIDRVVRAVTAAPAEHASGENPLAFKPKLDALAPSAEDADEEAVYQPPKLASVPFMEDESAAAKKERMDQRERRRLSRSRMMQELRQEYSDMPDEIREDDALSTARAKNSLKEKERREYEEDNFVRLTVSKKDKKLRQSQQRGMLADLTELTDLRDYIGKGKDGKDDKPNKFMKKETMRQRIAKLKKFDKK